jgi:acetyltransferase-like isoleucine patch superfamily enzyme
MITRIKIVFADILLCVLKSALTLLPITAFGALRRYIQLKQLSRMDGPAAAVEYARDSGVKIGKDCRFYGVSFGVEPFLIEIGNNVLISGNVQFLTHDGAVHIFRKEISGITSNFGKIKIGDNCFIGFGAIILPNIQIGNNCIICAGAVVADSFPDGSVIMGNPAKRIFATALYKAMKISSKFTLINEECYFPKFDFLSVEARRRFILERIDVLPIRKPRLKNK